MKTTGVALLIVAALSSCATKNVSAHSELMGWDIPNSVVSESTSSKTMISEIAKIYEMSCGESESFDLIDQAAFDKSYKEIIEKRGFKQTAGPYEGDAQIYLLTGPESLLSVVSKSRFTVCKLT